MTTRKGYKSNNGGDNTSTPVFTLCVNSSPPGWVSMRGGRRERGEAGRRKKGSGWQEMDGGG